MANYLATHKKAIIGAALSGIAAAATALFAGSTWQAAAVAGVGTALGVGGGVGTVTNKPAAAKQA